MPGNKEESDFVCATYPGKVVAKEKVIVGADVGTTFSGVAFAYRDSPTNVKYITPNVKKSSTSMQVPTVLLKHPGGWLFGNDAVEQYQKYVDELEFSSDMDLDVDLLAEQGIYFFKHYKMELKDQERGVDSIVARSTSGHPHKVIDLMTETLRGLTASVLDEIKKGFGAAKKITKNDILWVVTIPAIWNDFGKAFMRKAAFRAGLISDEASTKLLLALEPEAAALAMYSEGKKANTFSKGSKFMVLDIGGGTADIVISEVQNEIPLELDMSKPAGGAWGGIYVEKDFEMFLEDFIGKEMLRRLRRLYPNDVEALFTRFCEKKEDFQPGSNAANLNPVSFQDILQDDIRAELGLSSLEQLLRDYNLKMGRTCFDVDNKSFIKRVRRKAEINFTDEQMMNFFMPTMLEIWWCVNALLNKHRDIDTIVLVGGYGSSPVMVDSITSRFGKRVSVIKPDQAVRPEAAIVHGAVHYGLFTEVIGTRIASKTYGVDTSKKWYEGCRFSKSDAHYVESLKQWRVDDVFSRIVKRDDKIRPGKPIVRTGYSPVYPNQTSVTFKIYQTDAYDAALLHDGCQYLGEVTVPCRGLDDEFDVEFIFGSELRVEIVRSDGDRRFVNVEIE